MGLETHSFFPRETIHALYWKQFCNLAAQLKEKQGDNWLYICLSSNLYFLQWLGYQIAHTKAGRLAKKRF